MTCSVCGAPHPLLAIYGGRCASCYIDHMTGRPPNPVPFLPVLPEPVSERAIVITGPHAALWAAE